MNITKNLNLAVAFATCGVDVRIEKMIAINARSSSATGSNTCFHLAEANTPNEPSPDLTGVDMEQAEKWFRLVHQPGQPLAFRTGVIKAQLDRAYIAQLKTGLQPLEDVEPLHPILDCLIGLSIREKLLSFLKRGERYHVVPVPGVPRAILRPGQEPEQPAAFHTSSLALAAALVRLGVPVIGCTGAADQFRLLFPAWGHALHEIGAVDAAKLATALASGDLARQCPGHPAVWVMMAVENRNRLLANIQHQRTQLMLHDPTTLAWEKHYRSAVIYDTDKPEVWSKAAAHLKAV